MGAGLTLVSLQGVPWHPPGEGILQGQGQFVTGLEDLVEARELAFPAFRQRFQVRRQPFDL
jgi:hypothetical protein